MQETRAERASNLERTMSPAMEVGILMSAIGILVLKNFAKEFHGRCMNALFGRTNVIRTK